MMDAVLQKFGELISANFGIGVVVAFVAGILTVFTPCSLSSIPLIVAYVGGTNINKKQKPEDEEQSGARTVQDRTIDTAYDTVQSFKEQKKKAFLYSVFICLGQTIVFVTLGLIAASFGRLMGIGGFGKIWNSILIVLMIWMSLEMFGITNLLSRGTGAVSKVTQKGIFGALLVGMAGALFSTPCSTPVLTAMLAYVSANGSGLLSGGLLLLSYSLGHSILLVAAGTSIGFVETLNSSKKLSVISSAAKIVLGLIMLGLAAYLVAITFFS
jgi:cytochrome c biogenesis protein CcdA